MTTKVLLSSFLAAGLTCSAGAAVVFDADFDAATAISGSVSANADATNLNSGTATGSWTLTRNGNTPGAIVANAAQDNSAFAFDEGISTGNGATGLFTERVDLAAGDTLSFEFDLYASRQGLGREVRLALTDTAGTVGSSRAYVLIFGLDNNKNLNYLNDGNAKTLISDNAGGGAAGNDGFTNPAVDNYLSWSSGTAIKVRVDVAGATTVSGTTGATVSVDWNGDGDYDETNEVQNIDIGPRDVGVTGIDRFELFYSGTGTKGAYVDNIRADRTPIPEPGSLALLGLGGLLVARRRRD